MTRLQCYHLEKLCEEHGYTCEWASGQKPQLTKQAWKVFCKTENFVPLVVLGMSSNSGTSSSSTSPPQHSSSTSSSTPPSPAPERSDEPAPGNWSRDPPKNPNKTGTTVCETFQNGWTSYISGTQEPQYFYSIPKRWKVCLRTKMTRALCRRRTGEAVPRAEHFGDLITTDHKVLSKGYESRNNDRYAVVVQDLAT